VPTQISVSAVETRSHIDKRLAIRASATQSVKSVQTAVIRYTPGKVVTARSSKAHRTFSIGNQSGPGGSRSKKETPTDAKRPAGVISLTGGFGGTPSPTIE
jgi:L,D-peptidoglycan transpeptidase YkuD (ErfK/YbiS/YcfS/YnhG family)